MFILIIYLFIFFVFIMSLFYYNSGAVWEGGNKKTNFVHRRRYFFSRDLVIDLGIGLKYLYLRTSHTNCLLSNKRYSPELPI